MLVSSGKKVSSPLQDAVANDLLDQIKIMHEQEVVSYRCNDYLCAAGSDTTSTRIRGRNVPPLHLQRAAIEECARFIGILTVGCNDDDDDDEFPCNDEVNIVEVCSDEQPKAHEDILRRSPSSVTSPLLTGPLHVPSLRCSSNKYRVDSDGKYIIPRTLEWWRRQMVDWSYSTVDAFGFSHQTVEVCFSYVDRYLSAHFSAGEDPKYYLGKDDLQLLCMTCLYTAIKVCEPNQNLSAKLLEDMSNGIFCAKKVEEQEMDLLQVLCWRLNPPTATSFAVRFIELILPLSEKRLRYDVMRRVEDLSTAAVYQASLVSCNPSLIAISCAIIAFEECCLDNPNVRPDALNGLITKLDKRACLVVDNEELLLCMSYLR